MSVKKPLAIVATAAMVMTGAAFGSAAAMATPAASAGFVPGADIVPTTEGSESVEYNKWHFDPSHAQAVGQEMNGITVAAGGDVLIVKGNGNDKAQGTDSTTLEDLIDTIDLKASSTQGVTYQIPVRVDANSNQQWDDGDLWSTLRTTVGDKATWTTSKPLAGVAQNGSAPASTFTTLAGIYPIAAGFLVQSNTADTLVSSFEAGANATKFYEEPAAATPGAATSEYVDAKNICPNEATYAGWHDGTTKTATERSFETLPGENGATLGLKVNGKSQILNGLAGADVQPGGLEFANAMVIKATGGPVWAQVPVFYHADGVSGEKFTTLRAQVPASGTFDAATLWTTSKKIEGSAIAAQGQATIADFVAAMGQHEVLGYGAFVDPGVSATLTEITFNGATTSFAKTADPVDPPEEDAPFKDVVPGQKFSKEINWMAEEGITTGVKQADGSFRFEPKWHVTREAMAAFLYRTYATDAEKAADAPKVSPFADVKKGDKFYKEIAWMGTAGHSTGVSQGTGKANFQPKWKITREAMAAFVYRINDGDKAPAVKVSKFSDVKKGDKFFKEIAWLGETGLSTGIKQDDGSKLFAPKWNTTREAMAAFLFRADQKL